MEQLNLMRQFADPELIRQMSSTQLLEGTLITTFMGMGITFVILTLLMFCIKFLTYFGKEQSRSEKNVSTEMGPELIVLLMAAVIANEESKSKNKIIIRKIRQVEDDGSNCVNICSPKGIAIESNKQITNK